MRCWTLRPLLDSPFLASFLVFFLVRRLVGRLREGVLPLASLASQQPAEFAPRGGHHTHLSSLQKCEKAREDFLKTLRAVLHFRFRRRRGKFFTARRGGC